MAWSAVMSLSAAEREVLDLTVMCGMSASDAGLVTGLGADAASLIEQARANLQRAMGAEIAVRRPGVEPGRVSAAKVYARLPWPSLPPGTHADILACFADKRRAEEPASHLEPASPRSRRLAVGLLAAAAAAGAALILAVVGLPGGTWSAVPAGSSVPPATNVRGESVANANHGIGAEPVVAPPADVTRPVRTERVSRHLLGPGPGTGSAAVLYLNASHPRSAPGQGPGGHGAGQGSQTGAQPGGPTASQPCPGSSAPTLPPPSTGSPTPSGSGSGSPSGSDSPSPSPSTSDTSPPPSVSSPPPSVSSSASASPPPPSASPGPSDSSGASGPPAPSWTSVGSDSPTG
jgi:hypothetical protein